MFVAAVMRWVCCVSVALVFTLDMKPTNARLVEFIYPKLRRSTVVLNEFTQKRHTNDTTTPLRQSNDIIETDDASSDSIATSLGSTLRGQSMKLQNLFEMLNFRPKEPCTGGVNGDKRFSFYCPTPPAHNLNEWLCIRPDQLCNGIPDCPNAEDEDPSDCMFFLAVQHQNQQLRKIIISHYEDYHFNNQQQQQKRSITESQLRFQDISLD